MTQETAIVIGGSGFLGKHLCQDLLKLGYAVRVFDIRKTWSQENVEIFIGDINDVALLSKALDKVDIVFNCASPPYTIENRALFEKVNIQGTKTLIQVCRQHQIKRLVLTSSCGVIFEGKDNMYADDLTPYTRVPSDYYTETKIIQEKLVLEANGDGFYTCAIRPHGIFGPGDPLLVPQIIAMAKEGKSKYIIGDGSNVVDFTYVKNVTHGHILAAEQLTKNPKVRGQAFIITNDEPIHFWVFLSQILSTMGYPTPYLKLPYDLIFFISFVLKNIILLLGYLGMNSSKLQPTFTPFRVAIAGKHHYYSCEKAKSYLGYKPIIGLEAALKETLDTFPRLRCGQNC